MQKKLNAFIHCSEKMHKALLYDKFSGKTYSIPYEIGKKASENNLNEFEMDKLYKNMLEQPDEKYRPQNSLGHLRLLITNRCNFKCIYCYADEGTYGMEKYNDMSSKVGIDIINWFYKRYNYIQQISFFGGEPLINVDAIEAVCSYISDSFDKGDLEKLPMFSMVTNGYLLNKHEVEIIEKYKIHVVASIDGPKVIQDKQRLLKNGRGTYDKVYSNLQNLREIMPFSIESTYTCYHEEECMTREDTREFFIDLFHIDRVLVNSAKDYYEEMGNNGYIPKSKMNYSNYMDDFFKADSFIYDDFIIRIINVYRTSNYLDCFCDAGFNQYTVDMSGNIYPCHIFVGKDKYILGNIYNKDDILNIDNEFSKKTIGKCINCADKRFCQMCLLDINCEDEKCHNFKNGIENFLHSILELRLSDELRYRELMEGYGKYGKQRIQ